MFFHFGNILSLAAFLFTTVHCVDETISATRCNGSNRKKTCQFNSKKLNLDTASSIDFVAFNGKHVKCGKKKVRGDNVWYGICDGDASDANFVRRKDRKSNSTQVFGSVRIGSDVCQFSPNAEGVGQMTCTAIADFPAEDEAIEPPPLDDVSDRALQNLTFGFHPNVVDDMEKEVLHSLRGNLRRRMYDNSGATIDVMIVWTKQAECKVSKLTSPCTLTTTTENNIRGLIDLAIAETNTAFQLSGIMSSLRLVHAYRDPVYVEPTSGSYSTALDHLRSSTDGKLDDVHAKRALYGADMVQMFLSPGSSCGTAYKSSNRAYTFAVVSTDCATGHYSYAHEIGHNFVMNHDRGTDNVCNVTATSGFNYGYRAPDASFRTILAYDCVTGQCDNMPKNQCRRVQRFSNTQFLYDGKPAGNQYNDNAKQWNNIRAIVASHFPAMNCNSNSQCNDNNVATVDTCNVAKAVCVFTPIVPTKAPTQAPTKRPTVSSEPIHNVTKAPTRNPTKTPVSNAPTKSPTSKPTLTPVSNAPVAKAPPSLAPAKVPTLAPIVPTPSYYMESKVITGVSSSQWADVSLSQNYLSPIAVCTVQYDTGNTLLPAVVRMQNVLNRSFQIRIQNPSNQTLTGRTVHCVIVEEGAYSLPDGRKIEARKYTSTVTDHARGWSGQAQTYVNRYSNPIVVGQVMTFNDVRWSVFYSRGSTDPGTPPNAQSLRCGKHLGEDRPITRSAETVGYIVIERGHVSYSGTEIEFGRTPVAVVGYVNATYTTTFATPFASTPIVTVASQVGTKGREGSWAVVSGNTSSTFMGLSVDEDQNMDSERSHPAEEVDYIALTSIGVIQLTK